MCELHLSGCCQQFRGFSACTDGCVLAAVYWRAIPALFFYVIQINQDIGKSLSWPGKGLHGVVQWSLLQVLYYTTMGQLLLTARWQSNALAEPVKGM